MKEFPTKLTIWFTKAIPSNINSESLVTKKALFLKEMALMENLLVAKRNTVNSKRCSSVSLQKPWHLNMVRAKTSSLIFSIHRLKIEAMESAEVPNQSNPLMWLVNSPAGKTHKKILCKDSQGTVFKETLNLTHLSRKRLKEVWTATERTKMTMETCLLGTEFEQFRPLNATSNHFNMSVEKESWPYFWC